jgi:hypothetical protein
MELSASKNELTGRWTLEGVEPGEVTFDRICKMLRDKVNFKFARYGDGEFLCMSGKIGRNCDKHEYFPDLGMALNDAFYSHPQYMVGIQPLSVSGGLYQRAIKDKPGPKNIYDADILHSASIDGKLFVEFTRSLNYRHIVLVSPKYLLPLELFGSHIPISETNCWKEYDLVRRSLSVALENKENMVVLLCASMMSEVIINDFKDSPNTFIDCGSVFDPYVGKLSRRYHHKLNLNERSISDHTRR